MHLEPSVLEPSRDEDEDEKRLDAEPLLAREPTSPVTPVTRVLKRHRVHNPDSRLDAAVAAADFPVAETVLFVLGVAAVSGALAWCAMSGRAVALIEFLHENKLVGSVRRVLN